MKMWNNVILALALILIYSEASSSMRSHRIVQFDQPNNFRKIIAECSDKDAATAQRKFSYSLFTSIDRMTTNHAGKNIIVSPLSIGSSLAVLLPGAVGSTKQQIEDVLFGGSTFSKTNVPCLSSVYTSERFSTPLMLWRKSAWLNQSTYMLKATKLFGEESVRYRKSFVKKTTKSGFKFEMVNFKTNPEMVRKRINTWVSRNTQNQINQFFNEGDIDSTTKLAVVSTVYFQGIWQTEFKEYGTYEGEFRLPENGTVNVQFMDKTAFYRTLAVPSMGVDLIELPYRKTENGIDASMILLMPRDDTNLGNMVTKIENHHPGGLYNLLSQLLDRKTSFFQVILPKFKVEARENIKVVLKRMGVRALFQRKSVDLSNMSWDTNRKQFCIKTFEHKAIMGVNEKGTEVVGATGLSMGVLAAPPRLKFNKPFMFIIMDKGTRTILFIGRISDPTKE